MLPASSPGVWLYRAHGRGRRNTAARARCSCSCRPAPADPRARPARLSPDAGELDDRVKCSPGRNEAGARGVVALARPPPWRPRPRRLRRDAGRGAVAPAAPGFCSACGTASSSRSPGSSRSSPAKVAVYAVPNNGGWYDFGYFLGIVVFGVGAKRGQSSPRPGHRRPRAEDRLMAMPPSRQPRSGSTALARRHDGENQGAKEPTSLRGSFLLRASCEPIPIAASAASTNQGAAQCPFSKPASSTSRSNIPGRSNIGSASSRSTGCRRKCRWARIAATGRRSSTDRAQPAHPDLPLLHPGRCRGAGLLPRQIRPRVQADRDQDDADRLLQHGDGAHRGLLASARHDRHAGERILAPSSSTRR